MFATPSQSIPLAYRPHSNDSLCWFSTSSTSTRDCPVAKPTQSGLLSLPDVFRDTHRVATNVPSVFQNSIQRENWFIDRLYSDGERNPFCQKPFRLGSLLCTTFPPNHAAKTLFQSPQGKDHRCHQADYHGWRLPTFFEASLCSTLYMPRSRFCPYCSICNNKQYWASTSFELSSF